MRENDIPRLTPGPHMGFLEGFDHLGLTVGGTDRQLVADTLRAQSIDAGMTISRVLVDWSDLETSKGVYDRGLLEAALDYAASQGVSPFVTLSTLDSEELTLPSYLDGKKLNSNKVSDAWVNLLEWLVPILTERGVWALSMGNEVGILIQEGKVGKKEALDFYKLGAKTIKALDPDMATTITFSADVEKLIPDLLPKLVKQLDIVSFNYAGLNSRLVTQTKQDWADKIAAMKAIAGAKDIIIQELGAPAGYGDAGDGAPLQPDGLINSSPGYQAKFLKYLMKQFAYDDQLRAAVIFQLYDWSPELANLVAQPLHDAGFHKLANKYEEWLASTGMVRWADATPREVYGKWLEGLNLTQSVRLDDYDNHPDGRVQLEFSASGEIGYRADHDKINFAATTAGRYIFELEPESAALGTLSSPVLTAFGIDGSVIKTGKGNGADGQKLILGLEQSELVTLAVSGSKPGDLGGWTLSAYQLLQGSADKDALNGSDLADYIQGFAGRDTLHGAHGADKIFGGKGGDLINGGKGRDLLFGDKGTDQIHGNAGADFANGGAGRDDLFGGAGTDVLLGGAGQDSLFGGAKTDILMGGRGIDTLAGGAGRDYFVFAKGLLDGSSAAGTGLVETITDFKTAKDFLDFTAVDANANQSGNQAFDFISGAKFSETAGELRFAGGRLRGDVDGDGQADFAVRLEGITVLDSSLLIL